MGEAQGASGDVLLRAIKDAYDRWIIDEGAKAQLKAIHAQMDGKYISKAGTAFGKALGKFTGPFEDMVKTVFSSLEEAQRMIEGGGLTLPRLSAEAAYDLVTLLAKGQPTPVVAVLNQWEDGSRLKEDVETLKAFLDNLREWPNFHVVLHLRNPHLDDEDHIAASDLANTLARLPGAESIEVGPIDFENDPTAYENVIAWLAAEFPALAAMEAGDHTADLVMEMIRGNPAVLDEWWYLSDADSASLDRMAAVADDAQALLYPELWRIYRGLLDAAVSDDARIPALEVALLAAVLPLPPSAPERAGMLSAIRGTATDNDLVRLESARLFRREEGLTLSLGHPSRREAAERGILGQNAKLKTIDPELAEELMPYLRTAIDRVVPALVESHPAEAWSRLELRTQATAAMLASLGGCLQVCEAGSMSLLLCAVAKTLFGEGHDAIPMTGVSTRLLAVAPATRCFVAMGLLNAFKRSALTSNAVASILDDLRLLHSKHPNDDTVSEQFAKGLCHATTWHDLSHDDIKGLVGDLRTLAVDHSDHKAVREWVAKALFNVRFQSTPESKLATELLEDLRAIVANHPGDAVAREVLSSALLNAFADSKPTSSAASGLFCELHKLAEDHPDDDTVQQQLARAHGVSVSVAIESGNIEQAAIAAEALLPLRNSVLMQEDKIPVFQQDIDAAAEKAAKLGDTDAERRLRAVYETLFGGDDGPDAPAEPAPPTPEA